MATWPCHRTGKFLNENWEVLIRGGVGGYFSHPYQGVCVGIEVFFKPRSSENDAMPMHIIVLGASQLKKVSCQGKFDPRTLMGFPLPKSELSCTLIGPFVNAETSNDAKNIAIGFYQK